MVLPADAAPLEDDEDDISDPDEESIAGQMEAMRKQNSGAAKKAPKKKVVPKKQAAPVKSSKKYEDAQDSTDSEADIDSDEENPHAGEHNHGGSDDDAFIE